MKSRYAFFLSNANDEWKMICLLNLQLDNKADRWKKQSRRKHFNILSKNI